MKAMVRLAATAILPLILVGNSPPMGCMAGMQKTLVEQSFEPVFCSKKNVSFVLVGRTAGSGFSIYDYRYRFLPHTGGVMHGGQRLVVMRGKKYVGQYLLSAPPRVNIAVRGPYVVLRGEERKPVKLDFSKRPPDQLLVNGELETFTR